MNHDKYDQTLAEQAAREHRQECARYNHAFTVAFEVESDHESGEDVTQDMLRTALLRRMDTLDEENSWVEATGCPFDTYENDPA